MLTKDVQGIDSNKLLKILKLTVCLQYKKDWILVFLVTHHPIGIYIIIGIGIYIIIYLLVFIGIYIIIGIGIYIIIIIGIYIIIGIGIYIIIIISFRAYGTDIPDSLSSLLPIVHRLWQVIRTISRILT